MTSQTAKQVFFDKRGVKRFIVCPHGQVYLFANFPRSKALYQLKTVTSLLNTRSTLTANIKAGNIASYSPNVKKRPTPLIRKGKLSSWTKLLASTQIKQALIKYALSFALGKHREQSLKGGTLSCFPCHY